jgi:curved DNA-binding protein CbpA
VDVQDISKEHDCAEKFAQINVAYQTLSDPAAKATYDIQRAHPTGGAVHWHSAVHEDPIYQMLRRHRDNVRSGKASHFGAHSTASWCAWHLRSSAIKSSNSAMSCARFFRAAEFSARDQSGTMK